MFLARERGQTMPFWVIGVLVVLSTLFFLTNYVNAVVWQIRAQNAADAAASTSLAITANMWNEETTLLYAASIDEYRIRYLNQALLNTIEGVGCTEDTCASDYATLRTELINSVNGYDKAVQLLSQGNNFTEGGQVSDQNKIESLIGNDCSSAADYTCQFAFTKTASNLTNFYKKSGLDIGEVEYVACKKMPYFGSGLLNLGSGATYKIIGRGAAGVVPANSENFNPGTQTNPATGTAFQPVEHWATAHYDVANDVDFSGLTANLNWYTAGTIKPFGGNLTSDQYKC